MSKYVVLGLHGYETVHVECSLRSGYETLHSLGSGHETLCIVLGLGMRLCDVAIVGMRLCNVVLALGTIETV